MTTFKASEPTVVRSSRPVDDPADRHRHRTQARSAFQGSAYEHAQASPKHHGGYGVLFVEGLHESRFALRTADSPTLCPPGHWAGSAGPLRLMWVPHPQPDRFPL